jgi:hypothetical protein
MRTFESWVVIARGVELARKQANELPSYSVDTFLQILDREGLAPALGSTKSSIKSTASRLESILKNLPEIEAWRRSLPNDHARLHWSSPTAIYKHCPVFADRKPERVRGEAAPAMPAETVKALKKHNVRLQQEAAVAETMVEAMYERGDVFESGEVGDIADYIVKAVDDRERLQAIGVAILKSLGLQVSIRDPNKPASRKRQGGAHYARQRKAREAMAHAG